MKLLVTYLTAACCLLCFSVHSQNTLKDLAADTIIAYPQFLNTTYLLNGKVLNASVMEWFMSDYAEPYENIRISIISDQISVGSYTIGSLFLISSFLIDQDRKRVISDLHLWGAVGIGGGVIFQIVSGKFKRKAVMGYNDEIKKVYFPEKVKLNVYMGTNGLTGQLEF